MYPVDERDTVVMLSEVPPASGGAPTPFIVADEDILLLSYSFSQIRQPRIMLPSSPSNGRLAPGLKRKGARILALSRQERPARQLHLSILTGTAIDTNNFLFRVLKEAAKKAEISGVTHQILRLTCSHGPADDR